MSFLAQQALSNRCVSVPSSESLPCPQRNRSALLYSRVTMCTPLPRRPPLYLCPFLSLGGRGLVSFICFPHHLTKGLTWYRCPTTQSSSSLSSRKALPLPWLTQGTHRTYGIAFRALQFEVAVELVRGRALALHLLADVEGATPGAIFPAVDDVAPTSLNTTETQSGPRETPSTFNKLFRIKKKSFLISEI